MSALSKLEVGYWKIRGLGAPCRMMCELAGIDYTAKNYEVKQTENGYDKSEWFDVKPSLRKKNAMINLPYVLDVDGFIVTQSMTCMAYLGRKFGMYGNNLKETSKVDMVLHQAQELRDTGVEAFYGEAKLDPWLEEKVPVIYTKIDGWLESEGKGPYTLGQKPSAADVYLWEMLDQGEMVASDLGKPSLLLGYPRLRKMYDTMRSEPNLQRYFEGPLYHLPCNNMYAFWAGKPRSIGELHYFPLRARGEPLRYLLRYAGIPYTDRTISLQEWPEHKKIVPNGFLPALKLPEGKYLGETGDIARYISTRAGPPLMPRTQKEQIDAARIFRISNTPPLSMNMPLTNWFSSEDAEKKIPDSIAMTQKTLNELELELKVSGGAFFGGNQPHYGDFGLFHVVDLYLTLTKPSPKLSETWRTWYHKIRCLPGVKQYLQERPKAMSGRVGKPGSRITKYPLDDNVSTL